MAAETHVAVDGVYRKVASEYVAIDGVWRNTATGLVAVDGIWRSTYEPGPKVSLSLTKYAGAPYSRLVWSYTVQGSWSGLRVRLYHVDGTWSNDVATYGAASMSTVSATNVLSQVLWPSLRWAVQVLWTDSIGREKMIAEQMVTLDYPPQITNFWTTGLSHVGYTLNWAQPMDIDTWNSRNDSLGTNWTHPGHLTYIGYNDGLAPSSTYWNYTRGAVNGVYGPWSPAIPVTTSPKPYVTGTFYIYPNGDSQTYQSGGSQAAGWQGNSRGEWYGGNGAQWSSTRGHQRTIFYYSRDAQMNNLDYALRNGGQITNAKLYIGRGSGSGYSGTRAVPYALHQSWLPSPPANSSGNLNSPGVPENGGIWFDVPAHWVGHVIKGEHYGFLIGDVNSATYYANYTKSATGRIEVTIV